MNALALPTGEQQSGRRAKRAVLLLAAFALLIHVWPGLDAALEMQRGALLSGEAWRVITCQWTHWSAEHLFWDLAAFVVLAILALRVAPERVWPCLAVSTVLIPLGVWLFQADILRYRGLSGIDAALFVLAVLRILRMSHSVGNWRMVVACSIALAALAGKIGYESFQGAAIFVRQSALFVPVPVAHLIGGVIGAGAAFIDPASVQRTYRRIWRRIQHRSPPVINH